MLRTRAFFPLLYGVAALTCNNFERTSGLPEFLLVIFSRLLVGKRGTLVDTAQQERNR